MFVLVCNKCICVKNAGFGRIPETKKSARTLCTRILEMVKNGRYWVEVKHSYTNSFCGIGFFFPGSSLLLQPLRPVVWRNCVEYGSGGGIIRMGTCQNHRHLSISGSAFCLFMDTLGHNLLFSIKQFEWLV